MAGCLGASQAKEDPGKPWGGLELSEELRVSLEQTCLSVLVSFRRWLKCGPQEPRAMEDVVAQEIQESSSWGPRFTVFLAVVGLEMYPHLIFPNYILFFKSLF